jgi:hypothetical protein
MSLSGSYSSARCDGDDYEDEMFKSQSKNDDSCLGDASTMFDDEDKCARSLQHADIAPTRPTSLKTAAALVSPTNSEFI